jgi:hypothetical protein
LWASSANATFLPFMVDESVVDGAVANTFTAGKLNGGFTEALTITGAGTFSASAFADIGQYFNTDGTLNLSNQVGLGLFGASNQYKIYAVFSAQGTFSGNSFTGTSGAFDLYIDADSDTVRDTTVAFVGTSNPTLLNTADDELLGSSSTLLSGVGELDPTPPNAFDFIFGNFALTTFGKSYFVDPDPFYMIVRSNGDTDGALVPPVGETLLATGDVSGEFFNAVPEPATLGLVGLSLLGVGLARRKKYNA